MKYFKPLFLEIDDYYFDTALLDQPPLSVMTYCDLLFVKGVKSAVFPIIVVSKYKTYQQFILYGWSYIETQM